MLGDPAVVVVAAAVGEGLVVVVAVAAVVGASECSGSVDSTGRSGLMSFVAVAAAVAAFGSCSVGPAVVEDSFGPEWASSSPYSVPWVC